tara:strand:- start:24 stop:317 length:294 start_codon:yes stop_codon:yes gene_type:complete
MTTAAEMIDRSCTVQDLKDKKAEDILSKLSSILGGLEIIHREYTLEDLNGLERALEPLNTYLERALEDLDYYADEHDPESGIDTRWLRGLINDVRGI